LSKSLFSNLLLLILVIDVRTTVMKNKHQTYMGY
jgi:hypothetical protein